jgi:hypothetical protein
MAGKGGYRPGAGRPKAQHTIQAEAAKAELVKMFLLKRKPIFERLIALAEAGDKDARKELFERVWGKVSEQIDLGGEIKHQLDVSEEVFTAIVKRAANSLNKGGKG